MNEYKDYREAMKSFRRTQNFARQNFAFPFVIPALAAILPAIKIVASLLLLFSFAKEAAKLIFKKVPHFFSRLREYKTKSKEYVKEQEVLNQKRDELLKSQKKLLSLVSEVGRELADILKQTGNPKYKEVAYALDKQEEFYKSDLFQSILDGDLIKQLEETSKLPDYDPTKQEKIAELQKAIEASTDIFNQFIKSYDEAHPEQPHGFIVSTIVSMFPAAGYLAGGPEAMNALSANLISKVPTLTQGSLAQLGTSAAVKGLNAASKLNAAFFSLPMVGVSLATIIGEGVLNSQLTSKVQQLSQVMARHGKTLEEITAQNIKINQVISEFKTQFDNDINEVRQVLKEDTKTSDATKAAILKNLDKLQNKLHTNYSLVTETVGSLAKTGVNLLKNKTFDTAMLGMIAGMAIEKYRNKQEEELANKLLTEEANKMKKFRLN